MQPVASARTQMVSEFVAALESVAGNAKETSVSATYDSKTVTFKYDKSKSKPWFKKKSIVIGVVMCVIILWGINGTTEWKANFGNPKAQNVMGVRYEYGDGRVQDYAKAVYWYTKAAEQGNSEGQYILGDCYYKGEGVTKDYEKAAYCWTKAAEQGNEDAQKALDRLKPIM